MKIKFCYKFDQICFMISNLNDGLSLKCSDESSRIPIVLRIFENILYFTIILRQEFYQTILHRVGFLQPNSM